MVSKVDFVKKYTFKQRPAKLKFGLNQTIKQRDFSIDDYQFEISGNIVADGNADNLLLTENIWTYNPIKGLIWFGVIYMSLQIHLMLQNISAAYISNEFGFTKVKAVIGLRTELFTTIYTGQNQAATEIFVDRKSLIN